MYRSLLVPLDRSTFGEHALPLALSIARRAGARLHLVHVHSPLAATYAPDKVYFNQGLETGLKQSSQAYLEDVAKRLAKVSRVPITSALVEDQDIATSIRMAATGAGADLVVMTTHGRGTLGRFWLGSVAYKLIRELPMPLLLVRPEETAPDFGQEPVLKHVLTPLDGSPVAEQILETAVALGGLMDADYTLLRVIQPVWPGGGEFYGSRMGLEAQSLSDQIHKAQKELFKEAEEYLDKVANRLRSRSLRVQTRVEVEEHPAQVILNEAKVPAIDLIAMETHGRRGLSRLFLGSVADKVIRGTALPILVNRPQQA